MSQPLQKKNDVGQILMGVLIGACCALALKALIWIAPLMMFVGD